MRAELTPGKHPTQASTDARASGVRELLKGYYEGRNHLRRGLCLLTAGQYDEAIQQFAFATKANPRNRSLPACLAAAYLGSGRFEEAAGEWEKLIERAPKDVGARVRHSLTLWKAGRNEDAMLSLREAVRACPESAEIHFQLGNMLADRGETDEAELRFTQAVTLEKEHAGAWIGLAMCHGVTGDLAASVRCLQKAQSCRPNDPRTALLLGYACKGAGEARAPVIPVMPAEHEAPNAEDIEALSAIIESEPDLVEAVLSLDGEVGPEVFVMLADTLNRVLARRPQHADLHYQCGCVLERLGRIGEAIASIERAVGLSPRYIQALIQLAKLYARSDRKLDARQRLEEAIAHGGEYADLYFLLGTLYREGGMVERAVTAYRQALRINPAYEAAQEALATVAA